MIWHDSQNYIVLETYVLENFSIFVNMYSGTYFSKQFEIGTQSRYFDDVHDALYNDENTDIKDGPPFSLIYDEYAYIKTAPSLIK